ncbi:MAG: aldehyde dehydrogenase family protein [Longimicrobiales bacterium]|nr:aldehyde dehydrogenase family protein [Longimicrobiales bacterium]
MAAARIPVSKTYKLFIGGQFPRTESGRFLPLHDGQGRLLANVCRASRKDFRNAVVAARKAFPGWASASAYLRGQILYRIAEMLESRRDGFVEELTLQGAARRAARSEVETSIDRLIHYAGWSDKYTQVFSTVNPVSSPHFNFSIPEPTGVVALIAPPDTGLLGLVSNLAPALVGGNTVVALASERAPLSAVSLAEVIHASDVPAGVVNLLTGRAEELAGHFASHMDVNALVHCGDDALSAGLQTAAAENLKRLVLRTGRDWSGDDAQDPYLILDTQEIKTTWHPVGG